MKYYLAPMEGLTTYHFRRTWHKYYGGMDKYFTPFISNKHMSSRERNDILPEHNPGMNTIPQILTNRTEEFLELSKVMAEYGYQSVNLNLGCPSGTVVSRKRGAGFLSVPDDLERFLDEIFEKCPLSISIKTRIGVTDTAEWSHILSIYRKFPMEELIIHPRLQKEGYGGIPHLDAFSQAMEQLDIPLCYNGDIVSRASRQNVQNALPGIDTFMIGRGILQYPGLLQELKADGAVSVAPRDVLTTLRAFHDELFDGYLEIMCGDTNTLYKMKDLWSFLGKNFAHSEKYLKKIKKASKATDYRLAVDALFRECDYLPSYEKIILS